MPKRFAIVKWRADGKYSMADSINGKAYMFEKAAERTQKKKKMEFESVIRDIYI